MKPICRHCHRAIWPHVYGGETIWRHFTPGASMLCQPDETAPDFTGTEGAEPTPETDAELEAAHEAEQAERQYRHDVWADETYG